jgi:hypothetical protein
MSESQLDNVVTQVRAVRPVSRRRRFLGDGNAACQFVHPDGSGPDIRNDDSAESRT